MLNYVSVYFPEFSLKIYFRSTLKIVLVASKFIFYFNTPVSAAKYRYPQVPVPTVPVYIRGSIIRGLLVFFLKTSCLIEAYSSFMKYSFGVCWAVGCPSIQYKLYFS